MKNKGLFITFEGSEGSGKSTQAKLVYDYLKSRRRQVLFVREPGGVAISEAIREILLDVSSEGMTDECETLLYMAARSQLVHEVIVPALNKGMIVLCDRFLDSTVVYQGYGNGVDVGFIKQVGKFVTRGIVPRLTFIFDLDAREGLARRGEHKDRIEQRSLAYHNKVRRGYLAVARSEPKRVKIINAAGTREVIFATVRGYIDKLVS